MISLSVLEYALIVIAAVLSIVVVILGRIIKKLSDQLMDSHSSKRSFF